MRYGTSLVLEIEYFSAAAPLKLTSLASELRRKANGVLSNIIIPALAFLALLVLFDPGVSRAGQQTPDKEIYYLAAEYCRGTVPRPISLSSDNRVLCFDGWVDDGMDLRLARELADHGLFVVRGFGGSIATSIALADLLRDRQATVVIYDYCLSACASYFLMGSNQIYMLNNSLVAWRNSVSGLDNCTSLKSALRRSAKKTAAYPMPGYFLRISRQAQGDHVLGEPLLFGKNVWSAI